MHGLSNINLTGKNLWDAMIGVPSPGWSQKKLAELRPRYELVLQKHMELLFEDGKFDGKEGFSAPVRSDRMVTTLRGEVESWIPHEFASGLYNAGFQLVATPEVEEDIIREQVDMLGEAIYSAAGLPPQPLSKLLMPPPRPERKKDEDDSPENSWLATSAAFEAALFARSKVSDAMLLAWHRGLALLALAACFLSSGYLLMVATLRVGELTATAPFRYSVMVFAIISGILVFGEFPDGIAVAGMALIVACGLYAAHREALRARKT